MGPERLSNLGHAIPVQGSRRYSGPVRLTSPFFRVARTDHSSRLSAIAVARLLGGLLLAVSCGGGAARRTQPVSPTSPGALRSPAVLVSSHPGWENPQCGSCHVLPVGGHLVAEPWGCAQCHGANGACNPNGRPAVRPHAPTDDCVTCHQRKHAFTANDRCLGCHFATTGVVTCQGASGPGLPGQLESGCFGWPAAEFSPTNKAAVSTFLRAGQQAVDFALRDTAGATVRLSDLLRSRPVLLVHGSFT